MKVFNVLLVAFILFTACRKENPPKEPVDKFAVKLKDLNERNLPSPYYHFEYNDSGFVTHASIVSGLLSYNVLYDGTKMARMESLAPNSETLQYEYGNGQLKGINIINKQGVVYRKIRLTVSGSHQLQRLSYELLDNGSFVPEQYQQFSYYADGNLKELTQHYYAVGPQTELTFTDKFENYDSKINPEAFTLLHPTQMQHLILLPSFTLQKNNPGRITRTGDGVNFIVNHTYTYDAAGRALVRSGQLVFTNGVDSGKHFDTESTYSYYD